MIKYRADIDGLRAIAVLAVVIYHGFPSLLPGGFTGVDIFFVISGFLISSIIFEKLENGKFSISEFYFLRTRRIFPALILVLIVTLSYGWLRMQPDEFNQLLKHAASGSFFLSNFTYLSDSGYFDTSSEVKPLLHLWSLAIEEQFYLFWPVVIYFSWKWKPSISWILLIVFSCSFFFNIRDIHENVSRAFYLPGPRFWELFAGATLAYSTRCNGLLSKLVLDSKSWCFIAICGWILIFSGFFIISNQLLFPGWYALIPVLGTVLVIFSGAQAHYLKQLFSHPILIWIGLISYPLYLWHWPIFVFLRIEFSGQPAPVFILAGILLAFIFAWITFHCVEKPIRRNVQRYRTALLIATILFLLGAGSYFAYLKNLRIGVEQDRLNQTLNLDEKNEFYSYYADMPKGQWGKLFEQYFRNECNFFQIDEYFAGRSTRVPKKNIAESCYVPREPRKHVILLWGDSHAQMLNYGLSKQLPDNWQILQIASSGCLPSVTFAANSETEYCAKSNWFALETIKSIKPEVVVVAQSKDHDSKSFRDIAQTILPLGVKKLLVVGPSPHWTDDLPKIVIRRLWETKPERTNKGLDDSFVTLNSNLSKSLSQNNDQISYVDMQKVFCSSQGCLTRIGDDFGTNLTSWDYGHLTPIASEYFAKQLLAKKIVEVVDGSSN